MTPAEISGVEIQVHGPRTPSESWMALGADVSCGSSTGRCGTRAGTRQSCRDHVNSEGVPER